MVLIGILSSYLYTTICSCSSTSGKSRFYLNLLIVAYFPFKWDKVSSNLNGEPWLKFYTKSEIRKLSMKQGENKLCFTIKMTYPTSMLNKLQLSKILIFLMLVVTW